jgi:hypothetical protein
MAVVDSPQLVKDGILTLTEGMSSGTTPALIKLTQCAYALNATFRGGYAKNRPTFNQIDLSGAGMDAFAAGNFQGAAFYDIGDGQQHILAQASGRTYQIDLAAGGATVTDISLDSVFSPIRPKAYFCQADVYMVVQDGNSTPLIYQGVDQKHRAATDEVPVGQAMAYCQGRLWVSKGRLLAAGDIFGGPTPVIKFTENTYLNTTTPSPGFGTPLQSGDIVGLSAIEVGDTSTGQGELLVFCRKAIWSVKASVPRTSWPSTSGMITMALINVGGTSDRAITNVNSDCFFRAKDGWRSFRSARNQQASTEYGNSQTYGYTPISLEMKRVLATDTISLLDYGSSTLFRNRLLGLATPVPYQHTQTEGTFTGVYFKSLVALDFDILSGMRDKLPAAWDGEWQGLNFLQVLSNDFTFVERCIAFVRNADTGKTEIWEIDDDDTAAFDANAAPIRTVIESRYLDCGKPKNPKRIRTGHLYFNNVQADTTVTVMYRSDGYPNWVPWHTFKITAQGNLCGIPPCTVPGNIPGYWFRMKLPAPGNDCDPNTKKLLRNGYYFQVQIAWVGPSTMEAFVLHCDELVETPNGECP